MSCGAEPDFAVPSPWSFGNISVVLEDFALKNSSWTGASLSVDHMTLAALRRCSWPVCHTAFCFPIRHRICVNQEETACRDILHIAKQNRCCGSTLQTASFHSGASLKIPLCDVTKCRGMVIHYNSKDVSKRRRHAGLPRRGPSMSTKYRFYIII